MLTDTSIAAIEESLTKVIRSVTKNSDYAVRVQEFERTNDLGSLAITMQAVAPAG